MADLNQTHALLRFGQLPAEQQLAHFYVTTLVPVAATDHQASVTLDDDFSDRIANPAYQLFCDLVLQDFELMNLADAIVDDPGLHQLVDAHRFSAGLKDAFVRDLAWNTSHDGFTHGAHWHRIRARCKRLLRLLSPDPAPIGRAHQVSGLRVSRRGCRLPVLSGLGGPGQFVPRERWQSLRARVVEDYRGLRLRRPIAGLAARKAHAHCP